MKFVIKHEIKGRMRIHVSQYRMSYEQADTLLYFLHSNKYVTFAKVYERTGDAVISYVGDRAEIIRTLQQFSYEKVDVPAGVIENSGRELNAKYQEKLIGKIVCRYAGRMFLPYPFRAMCHDRQIREISLERFTVLMAAEDLKCRYWMQLRLG